MLRMLRWIWPLPSIQLSVWSLWIVNENTRGHLKSFSHCLLYRNLFLCCEADVTWLLTQSDIASSLDIKCLVYLGNILFNPYCLKKALITGYHSKLQNNPREVILNHCIKKRNVDAGFFLSKNKFPTDTLSSVTLFLFIINNWDCY